VEVKAKRLPEGLFGIEVKSQQRAFYLCTDSASVQQKWVAAVTEAIAQFQEANAQRRNTKIGRKLEAPGHGVSTLTRGAAGVDANGFGSDAPIWVGCVVRGIAR
jgi:hypothetical protein